MPNIPLILAAATSFDSVIVVPVDNWPDHAHRLTASIGSEPLEDGRSVTDHAVGQPAEVSITGYVSNLTGAQRSEPAWAALRAMTDSATLVRLITEFGIYEEMIIESADGVPDGRGMRVDLRLRQILRVGTPSGFATFTLPRRLGGVSGGSALSPEALAERARSNNLVSAATVDFLRNVGVTQSVHVTDRGIFRLDLQQVGTSEIGRITFGPQTGISDVSEIERLRPGVVLPVAPTPPAVSTVPELGRVLIPQPPPAGDVGVDARAGRDESLVREAQLRLARLGPLGREILHRVEDSEELFVGPQMLEHPTVVTPYHTTLGTRSPTVVERRADRLALPSR